MTLFDSGVPYTKLISTSNNGQRYRMMRYVMVLGIILVTIFLYVSYYTTPMASVDSRYSPSFVSQDQSSGIYSIPAVVEGTAVLGNNSGSGAPPPASQPDGQAKAGMSSPSGHTDTNAEGNASRGSITSSDKDSNSKKESSDPEGPIITKDREEGKASGAAVVAESKY